MVYLVASNCLRYRRPLLIRWSFSKPEEIEVRGFSFSRFKDAQKNPSKEATSKYISLSIKREADPCGTCYSRMGDTKVRGEYVMRRPTSAHGNKLPLVGRLWVSFWLLRRTISSWADWGGVITYSQPTQAEVCLCKGWDIG